MHANPPAAHFRRPSILRLLVLVLSAAQGFASAQTTPSSPQDFQHFKVVPRSTPALEADLSGGFAFADKDSLLLAARATTDAPALSAWTLDLKELAAWVPAGLALPQWSAAARHHNAFFVIGGLLDGRPTDQARRLVFSGGKPIAEDMPPLPKALAGAGAAVIGAELWVFGGLSSLEPAVFENSLWKLDLSRPGASWSPAESMPGPGRALAAVTSQNDALCVFGGLVSDKDGTTVATRQSWMFRPKPPEASLISGWKQVADMLRPAVAAAAFPVGQAAVAIAGGMESSPVALFPTARDLAAGRVPALYNTITHAWCDFSQPLPLATVIAAPRPSAAENSFLLLAMGEEGSRIRLEEFQFLRNTRSLNWLDYAVIGMYFLLIAGIGVISSRHHKSSAEFALAGRNVPWWVAGISMFASGASAISFMAIPALAFSTNLVFLFPILIYVLAYFVQSRLVFPLLRRMEITSTYEYLERRFNRTLRLIASAQCIIFQTFGRTSVVLLLPSLAISATTGIDVYLSVIVMWAITTLYTYAGGFRAVVYTDVFQGLLMFAAPIFIIAMCVFGIPGGAREFLRIGMDHSKFDFALLTWDATLPAVWILLLSTFMAGTIVQAGDQPTIQRVFSTPQREVRRVAAMSVACGILISVVTNVLGIAIFGYFHAHPAQLDPLSQNDKVVPLYVIQTLPHGFVGMVIAAIFAAAMTTIAGSMNSAATVFTEDFYLRFKPDASDRRRLLVLRVASSLVGLTGLAIALFMASMNFKSMMVTWTVISALLGGGIVGVYSLGMFTRHANGFGAVAGAIASILITSWVRFFTPLHWQTLIPIAILSCVVTGYLFSFLSKHRKDLTGLTIHTPQNSGPGQS